MELKIIAALLGFIIFTTSGEEFVDERLDDAELSKYDVSKLIKVSLASDRGYRVARTIFKWNYGHYTVEIGHDTRQIYTWSDQMYVSHVTAEQFLYSFCNSFEKLFVDYYVIPLDKQKAIGKYVNEYCSDTLVEFRAKQYSQDAFDNMTKPFTKVEHVAFDGVWKHIDSNSLGLNELFPNVRILNLTYSDGYILDRVFPKLVELNGDIDPSPALAKFIQKNSQINKLRLKSTSVEVLRAIDNLHNLKHLAFHVPSDMKAYKDDPVIQFGHVSDVSVTDLNRSIESGKIKFKQLKKLQLTISEQLDDAWIDIIAQNKDLDTLKITGGVLNNSTLLTLASKLSKLVEANVHCDSNIDIESIVTFLKSNPNMKTFTLNLPKSSVQYFNALEDKFSATENLKVFQVAPVDMRFDSIEISKRTSANGASYLFVSSTVAITLVTIVVNVFAY